MAPKNRSQERAYILRQLPLLRIFPSLLRSRDFVQLTTQEMIMDKTGFGRLGMHSGIAFGTAVDE